MNKIALAFCVGILGALVGGFVVVTTTRDSGGDTAAIDATDLAALTARLERLETALAMSGEGPALRGAEAPRGAGATGHSAAELDALVAQLEERLKPTIEGHVQSSVADAVGKLPPLALAGPESVEPKKKKVTLAEAAAEIGLSAEEEEDVRRIAKESTDAFLKILAGKDGDIEDVRREFEDAKADPKKRAAIGTKYLVAVMSNMGGVMGVMMTHQSKMKGAIGSKNADRLEREFDLSDLDPLGLETAFDFD